MLPKKRELVLVQCISNDITKIYLIRVSVTQPSTAASMEHRVAIGLFRLFNIKNTLKMAKFLSSNPDGT